MHAMYTLSKSNPASGNRKCCQLLGQKCSSQTGCGLLYRIADPVDNTSPVIRHQQRVVPRLRDIHRPPCGRGPGVGGLEGQDI
jgi:hypothetical protein